MDFSSVKEKNISWCHGCGNFDIRQSLIQALEEMYYQPENIVFVSGIGQSSKTAQFINAHSFSGLQGRSLSVATAVKASNPELEVIAIGGDGDMYAEGGNHFLHTIRRNPDIVHIVSNNMVYGLTMGQGSPTSPKGFHTPAQIDGVTNEPFNPIAAALSMGATFAARCYSGDTEQTKKTIKQAIAHKGYSLIDILYPCISHNKTNTHRWFKENTYYLGMNYDTGDRMLAMNTALQTDPFPLGVIYNKQGKPVFEKSLAPYKNGDTTPLYKRKRSIHDVNALQLQ